MIFSEVSEDEENRDIVEYLDKLNAFDYGHSQWRLRST
jgi:hypothetical protein